MVQQYPSILLENPTVGAVGLDSRDRGAILGSNFYAMRLGNTAGNDGGLRSYNIATGAQILATTATAVFGSATPGVDGPYAAIPTGQLFIEGNTSPGLATLIDPATLTKLSSFPTSNLPSLPTSIPVPQCYGATAAGGFGYVGCAPFFTFAGEPLAILQAGPVTTQFAGATVAFTTLQALCCGSPASVGKIFTLGCDLPGPSAAALELWTTQIGAGAENYGGWPVPNPNIVTPAAVNISIAAIDPSDPWTNATAITAPAFDRSDGNLIFMASTTDLVAHQHVVFKVRPSDGAVLWTTPVAGINEIYNAMPSSIVAGGVFRFMCGADQRLYVIDTATGAIISNQHQGLGGGFSISSSIDYAPLNGVLIFAQWASNAVEPPYGAGGTVPSGTEFWYFLQLAAAAGGKTQVYLIGSP